jgi:flagellar M-ring protein FliF
VSVVDQSGALLSQGVAAGEAAQLGYQARLEGLMRERLNALLTPLIGARRFTAEVAADVDFSTSEAASERFERDGSVLRSEQASRSSETSPVPARGIPGALSNTAPAAAQVAATPPEDTAAAPGGEPQMMNESTNRAWEIGKDVRVTRGGAPRLVRLSVAVVIDRAALARDGKVAPDEVASLQRIIEGAVGHDVKRGDRVEVVLRDFADVEAEPEAVWYEKPLVRDYAPLGLMALLVLVGGGFAGWRWRKGVKARALADAAAVRVAIGQDGAAAPVDGGDLSAQAVVPGLPPLLDYSGKLGATRELVTGDTDRATAVARMMLADDAALGEDAA